MEKKSEIRNPKSETNSKLEIRNVTTVPMLAAPRIFSPRFVHPEQALEFAKQVIMLPESERR